MTADLERGFGDASVTVAGAIEAGAVGCNLEDSTGTGGLWPAEEHAAVVAAARAAGEVAGVPLVINARTDVFLEGAGGVDEAVERGRAYLEAGADCIFVPGRPRRADARGARRRHGRPDQRVRDAGGPTLAEYARIGVARVSYGPGPMGVAMAALAAPPRRCSRAANRPRSSRSVRGSAAQAPSEATISARVPVPPVRRRRCGIVPSKRSVSPSLSCVDVAAELDLDRAAGDVDRHLARVHLVLRGPAAAARGPLAQDRRARLRRAARAAARR